MLRKLKILLGLPLIGVGVASCALLDGPDIDDLELISIALISPSKPINDPSGNNNPWPDKPVLVMTFTAGRDLAAYAKQYEYNIGNDTSFCQSDEIDTSRSLQNHPYVFDAIGKVDGFRKENFVDKTSDKSIYYVYMLIKSRPVGVQSVFSYDLKNKPEDICVQLRGGSMLGSSFVSNVIVVSRGAIVDALAQY